MHLDPESHSHHGDFFPPNYAPHRKKLILEQRIELHSSYDMSPVFSVDTIDFSYGSQQILHNVSFYLNKGTLCGLLGPNGSGKSTLFRCCMKFLKIAQGKIYAMGKAFDSLSMRELAKTIAYVPQSESTAFNFRVRDVVEMGRTPYRGLMGLTQKDKEAVSRAMHSLGVESLADNFYQNLSGGQKQMVLIARALAQETPLIFLDEPTAALDFHNQIMVWNALKNLTQKGTTVMVCCHDPNHILWFCDHVLCLKNGSLIASGHPSNTLTNPIMSHIFGDSCVISSMNNIPVVHPRFDD